MQLGAFGASVANSCNWAASPRPRAPGLRPSPGPSGSPSRLPSPRSRGSPQSSGCSPRRVGGVGGDPVNSRDPRRFAHLFPGPVQLFLIIILSNPPPEGAFILYQLTKLRTWRKVHRSCAPTWSRAPQRAGEGGAGSFLTLFSTGDGSQGILY